MEKTKKDSPTCVHVKQPKGGGTQLGIELVQTPAASSPREKYCSLLVECCKRRVLIELDLQNPQRLDRCFIPLFLSVFSVLKT